MIYSPYEDHVQEELTLEPDEMCDLPYDPDFEVDPAEPPF